MRNKRNEVTVGTIARGMSAVHILCKGSAVAIFGIAIKAGNRNESPGEYGLAHFVEHTIFKGTNRRRSSHIINRMEAVGGELNAYTTKEETVIYSVFPAGNLARAAELIADLASDSQFPERELAKEREVVADEIDSYLDSPSEAVFDDFEDYIFADSPLGHNILGTSQSLKHFDSEACRRFVSRNYHTDNTVAFYSGPRSASVVFKLLDKYLAVIPSRLGNNEVINGVSVPRINEPFDIKKKLGIHQAHCVVGARVGSYLDESRYPIALLSNIIGGPGMNSLLNVALRERRGLVYNVESSTALFSDCGLLTIYFGCDPEDYCKCLDLVRQCFKDIESILTHSRLEAAKRQYLGQLIIASENRESSILGAARSLLWRGEVLEATFTENAIRSLTTGLLIDAVQPLLSSSVLTFTPE